MSNRESIEAEWMSVRTLANLLDISDKTIWDWIYKSRRQLLFDPIPYYKLGGLVRFNRDEIHAWIERRKIRPAPLVNAACPAGKGVRSIALAPSQHQ